MVDGEMSREPQRKLLDLADSPLLGERVNGVLLGVGCNDLAVVSGEVARGKIPCQGHADIDVLDLMQ